MTVGVVSLVSVFENAIICFIRVRMAKSFGPDLQLYMVRLEALHLRLTRWGEAVGLNNMGADIAKPNTKPLASDDATVAKSLIQIEQRFEDAVKVVQDLDVGDDIAFASLADLGDKKSLVQGLRNMSIKRRAHTSVTTKAKWVIYQKEKLSSLIDDLSKLLNDLDHALPTGAAVLTPLCNSGASQLLTSEQLDQAAVTLLEDVATKLDEKLAEAIARQKAQVGTIPC